MNVRFKSYKDFNNWLTDYKKDGGDITDKISIVIDPEYSHAQPSDVIIVDKSQFITAHGKTPRGRRIWKFFFDSELEPWFISVPVPFATAIRKAKIVAKKKGYNVITVSEDSE